VAGRTSGLPGTAPGRGGAAGRARCRRTRAVGKARPRTGQCQGCLGWGLLAQPLYCSPCHQWRSKKYHQPGPCRRCSRAWLVNADGLCPPCIIEIQQSDAAWYFSPAPTPRPVQLVFIMPEVRLPHRMPFGSYRARSDGRFHPPPWARAQIPAQLLDDPRFCPPMITGQLPLFESRRTLVVADAHSIRDRVLAGWDQVEPVLAAYAAGHEYGQWWQLTMSAVLRLALAVREADGKPLVDDAVLDALPRFAIAAAEILRRARLLDAASKRVPGPRGSRHRVGPGPRSCQTCGTWGTRRRCEACRQWEVSGGYQPGTCQRCGQPEVPLRGGRCRACLVHVCAYGPAAVHQSWVQLWFALPGAGASPAPARRRGAGEPEAAPAASPHRIDPAQPVLFGMRRDWRRVLGSAGLPALTGAGQRLLDDFSRAQLSPGDEAAGKSARALRILVAWLGADAPFHEADVRALAGLRPGVQVRRVLTFLTARDMLIPDPGRQAEPRLHAVHRLLASLPGQIGRETAIWVKVVRGQGRVEHPALAYKTIRNYLTYLHPVLTGWAGRYASLREVTRQDILNAVDARHGPVIQHRIVALRSLFRALRQERVIFRDPTRGISLPAPARLPQPLPAGRVAGLLNRADGPAARLAAALVAIHAVPEADLIRLQTADLDLAAGTLTIRRGYRHRIVYLDEVTAALASQWLRYRHRRWPGSRNPHLLVSKQTAADTSPVGPTMIGHMFEPLGVRPVRLRQDRILDEARHTADPVHLVRVFGITESTAINYVHAAHPGRQSVIPR
jgi:integrase